MKSVLISIQPKWCELIASGKKILEVRKTRPKLDTPFKCYIYCTQRPFFFYKSKATGKLILKPIRYRNSILNANHTELNGKVIGEFVCNYISNIPPIGLVDVIDCKESCLSPGEIIKYSDGKMLYCWHISDLVIYDKPKELREFKGLRKTKFGYAPYEIARPPQSWCYVEER